MAEGVGAGGCSACTVGKWFMMKLQWKRACKLDWCVPNGMFVRIASRHSGGNMQITSHFVVECAAWPRTALHTASDALYILYVFVRCALPPTAGCRLPTTSTSTSTSPFTLAQFSVDMDACMQAHFGTLDSTSRACRRRRRARARKLHSAPP